MTDTQIESVLIKISAQLGALLMTLGDVQTALEERRRKDYVPKEEGEEE